MRTANISILTAIALTLAAPSAGAASLVSETGSLLGAPPAKKPSAADKAAADKAAADKAAADKAEADQEAAEKTAADKKSPADKKAVGDKKAAASSSDDEEDEEEGDAAKGPATTKVRGPAIDRGEQAHQSYIYVGARYRPNIIPQFLLNAFVDGGHGIYSNAFGVEIDLRKDGFSMIGGLTYTDYNTGNMTFHQKGKDFTDWNWSIANSSLKMVSANLDLLWSKNLAPEWDYEYGVGFSLGVVFGGLTDYWATTFPPGGTTQDGKGLTACLAPTGAGTGSPNAQAGGCNVGNHTNSPRTLAGGGDEKSFFSGGAIPTILPNIMFQPVGVRYRPDPHVELRANLGISLTGAWFGFSGDYGLRDR